MTVSENPPHLTVAIMQLLLPLWREASRHVALSEVIARMAVLVSRRLPTDLVLVRRVEPEQGFVETIAVGQTDGGPVPSRSRTPCPADEMVALRAWCEAGTALRLAARQPHRLRRPLLPEGLHGGILAGPLLTESGAAAVLLMAGRDAQPFTDDHVAVMQPLLEPFTVAFENHRRFHELERLREAAEAENRALLSRLQRKEIVEEIVGERGTLRAVMERVTQVAPTNAPVLILGETGTGKEVIARAIHARSARSDGPIVRVNCGAIPPDLIDSELFGHEKGSFTGAVSLRKGWFERADGGTLFLDEIGELPPAAQVRLLRILQDGSFERVGGQQTLTVNIRILAATHRDMESLVQARSFREDLWYRISVFPIYLPPLRARQQDLDELAAHFARNAGLRLGSAPLTLSADDMKLLKAYPWPGNVRELAAVIERAAILGGGHRLDVPGAMGTKLHALAERLEEAAPGPPSPPLGIDEAMKRHIEQALQMTAGRIEGPHGAAHLLAINPNTLRGRMRKLGINRQQFRRR